MTTLITGSGLIGCQIARELTEQGETPVLYDASPQLQMINDIVPVDRLKLVVGDILDLPLILRTIRAEGIGCIIHTAGLLVAGVGRNPYTGVRVNVDGSATVLEAARIEGLRRVVFPSSGTVYTSAYPAFHGPMAEDFPLRVVSERPSMLYAASKLFCEWLGLAYCDDFGVDFVALRFDSAFGPWRGTLGGRLSRLMQQLMIGGSKGERVIVDAAYTWSGGEQFVYSKDAAHAAVLAATADPARLRTRVYNVAMGRLYGFTEILDLVRRRYPGADIVAERLVETGLGGGAVRQYAYDMTLARAELGFVPAFDMERAIADYGDWLERRSGRV
jgi:UDP-glucose 4-epimerase